MVGTGETVSLKIYLPTYQPTYLERFIGEEGSAGVGDDPQHGGGEAAVEGGQPLLPPDGQEHGHQGPILLGPAQQPPDIRYR